MRCWSGARRRRRDARLDREQIGVAAAVEWDVGYPLAGYRWAQFGVRLFHLHLLRLLAHVDRLRLHRKLRARIHLEPAFHIDRQSAAAICRKAGSPDLSLVLADGNGSECVCSLRQFSSVVSRRFLN